MLGIYWESTANPPVLPELRELTQAAGEARQSNTEGSMFSEKGQTVASRQKRSSHACQQALHTGLTRSLGRETCHHPAWLSPGERAASPPRPAWLWKSCCEDLPRCTLYYHVCSYCLNAETHSSWRVTYLSCTFSHALPSHSVQSHRSPACHPRWMTSPLWLRANLEMLPWPVPS